MISPARRAAFTSLVSIESGQTTLAAALANTRRAASDARDQALAHDIVVGTERWRSRLDHVIGQASTRPIARMDPQVRAILRLSGYQLLFLDRVPARAVIDDAVALTRTAGKSSASGFVNAILRAISRKVPSVPSRPDPNSQRALDPEKALEYLAVTLSHPVWLAERWLTRLGFAEAEAWETFNNQTPRLSLSVNTLRTERTSLMSDLAAHGVVTEIARYSPIGLSVTTGNPLRSPLAERGLFSAQAEASQLVALFAGVAPGETVLDACAAPGGKTIVMAGQMKDTGVLVAADFRNSRMPILERTVRASGATTVRIVRLDLSRPLPFRNVFDCVFVDAPCSGLGTLQRDPDIRWRRRPEELPLFARNQFAQLTCAAEGVKPGGRLIYATCSSEPEENEGVVERFLATHPAFGLCDPRAMHQRTQLPHDVFDEMGCLRTQPHVHHLEAFFAAMLVRGK
jgi:16S rRNA (cytosine967-C5)-methyltransferase